MNYSITNLTQVADCNVLLSWAAREKADLSYKKISEERLSNKFSQTSQEIDATLQGVLIEISATETVISALADGPAREEAIDKKTRLEYKKFLLETRRETYGTVALLEKEMDLARVNQELEEVDSFMETIEARKAVLQAQA